MGGFVYYTKPPITMIDFSQFDSFIAMTMYFNNEAVCRNAIVETRWGIGEEQDIVCPYCGQHHCATRKDGKFRCNHCNWYDGAFNYRQC